MALIALALPSFASAEPEPFGTVTPFSLGTGAVPNMLAAGPDGNIWVAEATGKRAVVRVTPSGAFTRFWSAEGTGDLTEGSTTVENVVVTKGEFALKTVLSGTGLPGLARIVACSPSCASPTSLELSEPAETSATGVALFDGLNAVGMAAGSDGNLWFSQSVEGLPSTYASSSIDRITPSGEITSFTAGLNAEANVAGVAAGPDGNVWFTDEGNVAGGTPAIGKITPSGTITMFSTGLQSGARPIGITAGPDGNVWFTDMSASAGGGGINEIGKITPSGTITEYSANLNAGSKPGVAVGPTQAFGLTAGPDGNVWFTDNGTTKAIGKITPSGTITEYGIVAEGGNPGANPVSIAAAKGKLWFTDRGTTKAIGEVTTSGAIAEYPAAGFKAGIALGPDGNLWYGNETNVSRFWINTGPTNRRTLTITKSAGGSGGMGSVKSKPAGINCGTACNEAAAAMYKATPVTLTAKPSLTSSFVEWTGACTGSSPTCTVPMAEDEEVTAVFGGTSKAIFNPQALTVTKDESSGFGTVKGAGLACEAECTETTVLYQGPNVEKAKPGKTVILTQAAAPGSEFVEWGGACTGSGSCEVTMEEAKEVTATFEALPAQTLSLSKLAGGTGGIGTVKSKPAGINCATACSSAEATLWEGASVTLTAKPTLTSTFLEWEGGDCEGITATTCTVGLNVAEEVTAVFGGTSKAIFNPQALTLSKSGSGLGTVKASGLVCEAACDSTTVLYIGPNVEKAKPGKTVALTQTAAAGSEFVEWTGACSGSGACEVTMEEAEEVGAVFNELP